MDPLAHALLLVALALGTQGPAASVAEPPSGAASSLADLAALVGRRGAALSAADLLPFLDTEFRHDGFGPEAGAAELAQSLRRGRFDPRSADAAVRERDRACFAGELAHLLGGRLRCWRLRDGRWRAAGNGRLAKPGVFAATLTKSVGDPACPECDGAFRILQFLVTAPERVLASAMVEGGRLAMEFKKQPRVYLEDEIEPEPGRKLALRTEHFEAAPRRLQEFPPPGTTYTFTLHGLSGERQIHSVALGRATTETVRLLAPTGHRLADAKLGGRLELRWELPKSFAPTEVELAATLWAEGSTCEIDVESAPLPPTATSAAIRLPADCDGKPLRPKGPRDKDYPVILNLFLRGPRGEETRVEYHFR